VGPPEDLDAWRAQAKCKGLPASLFIPDGPGGSLDRAVAICHGWDGRPACPVRTSCYTAGELGNEVGVWGGQVRGQKTVRIIVPLISIQDARPRRPA
jgi:hypothetical protein